MFRWFKEKLNKSTSVRPSENDFADIQQDDLSVDDLVALSQMTPHTDQFDVDANSVGPMSAVEHDVHSGSDMLVIVLNLIAKDNGYLYGSDIQYALEQTGFVFGDMNIYHYFTDDGNPKMALCSVANLIEPGTLEYEQLEVLKTPGLSLFMQLPGPLNGREALESTLKLGRNLADLLGADLCDETRSVLSIQTIGHLKEKIEAFHFKQQMANIKNHRQ